jgi:3-hydroxyacyl-[acyl-carrier-protein] dehydratase
MRYVFLENFTVSEDKESLVGELRVQKTWSIFNDHFPGFPVFPGALIVETMAQHAVSLMMEHKKPLESVIPTLIQVDRAKFTEMVIPDCVLKIEVKKEFMVYPNFKFMCAASVDDKSVATARLTLAFRPMPPGQGLDFMGFYLKGGGA